MRILITGGAGCLGSNLADHFLKQEHDVLALDTFVTSPRDSLPTWHPRLTLVEGSVTDSAPASIGMP